jgi:hypothetical protein
MEKEITLRLKSYGCYSITSRGVFFYTEHGFRIFVPKEIIKKLEGMLG